MSIRCHPSSPELGLVLGQPTHTLKSQGTHIYVSKSSVQTRLCILSNDKLVVIYLHLAIPIIILNPCPSVPQPYRIALPSVLVLYVVVR
jgi:hypothetical protein